MDRADRFRVAWVALLAVGVMVGVVASALHLRALGRSHDPTAREPGTEVPYVPRKRPREQPLPAECEVEPGREPKAELDLPAGGLDFGSQRQGVVVEREVKVRNTGKGTLCILDHDTGCGCVKAEWVGGNQVPPGGTGTVKIRLDTAGRDGPVDRTIVLYLNEPQRRTLAFKVRADVRLGVVVES